MKVPISWLKDYIDIGDEHELMQKLTLIGHLQDGPPQKVGNTNVYDLEVRQNRPDCLSLLGIAREAGAVLDKKIKNPLNNIKPLPTAKGTTKVEIKDPDLCYRFNTVTMENLKVGESPDWLKDKLAVYGIKSVNNLVDVTNFVMVEVGQPLHAFDKEVVKDTTLIVRSAKRKEEVVVLGGRKITLDDEDLVIADTSKIVAIAGGIGSEESSVKHKTTSIILEGATYNQAAVRRTSLKHNIRTESSTRVEKFLHPLLTQVALERAVSLILKLCGGRVVDHTDSYVKKFKDVSITLNNARLERLGGMLISQKEAKELLKKLELAVSETSKGSLTVKVPYFRTDLEREEDIIEEVLRLYGYDKLPSRLPATPPPPNRDSKEYLLEEELKDVLVAAGFDEQITEPLTNEKSPARVPVTLENSLNTDKTMLRTTLLPSLLAALKNQVKYEKSPIKLFEVGKVYYQKGSSPFEEKIVGVISHGLSYRQLKGLLDLLEARFDTKNEITKTPIISMEEKDTYFFEFPLSLIVRLRPKKPLSSPPHILREDLSFIFPAKAKVGEVIKSIQKLSPLIYTVGLGEEPRITGETKTVFLHITFSSPEKTLTKEDANKIKIKIIDHLQSAYNANVRGAS